LSGKAAKEQQLVDGSVIHSLRLAQQEIFALQANQTEIDLALTTLGNAVNKVFDVQERLQLDVGELREIQQQQQLALSQLQERLQRIEFYQDAQHEIQMVLFTLSQTELRSWPALSRAYWATDRLWWGKLGVYYRHRSRDPRSRELMELARLRLTEEIAVGQSSREALRPATEWFAALDRLAPEDQQAMLLLSDVGSGSAPLVHAMHDYMDHGSTDSTDGLVPRLLSPQLVVNRLVLESRHVTRDPNDTESE
jgi:hypothetical protein